jgi:repressor LexA
METNRLGETCFGDCLSGNKGSGPVDGALDHEPIGNTSRYVSQHQNHTMMGFDAATSGVMAITSDQRREALRRLMLERGIRPKEWAIRAGANPNSIYNFLNGHSKSLNHETYVALAKAEKLPLWRLTGDTPELPSPTSVWVSGEVQAGEWREAVEWDSSLWYAVDVPLATRFRQQARALQVSGRSMDLLYQPGDVILWVSCYDFREPKNLDRVVVYSHRKDGMIEATVKEYREEATGRWLWPRSSDPTFQAPVNLFDLGSMVESVEIVGVVVGSYRAEIL